MNPHEQERIENSRAPLITHLVELRNRLMICAAVLLLVFGGCYYFVEPIFAFLTEPLLSAMGDNSSHRMIYTGLTEVFFTYISVAFYAALFISFPLIATQIYLFLAPGLYTKEKILMVPLLIGAPILFLLGAACAYYGIFPLAWKFFLSYETSASVPIQLEARVSEYLSMALQMMFGFGIAFQLPVVLVLLCKTGLITVQQLSSSRRYAIVLIAIVAAILTPPDVISQIGLALPLLLLYELSILACRWVEKSRQTNELVTE